MLVYPKCLEQSVRNKNIDAIKFLKFHVNDKGLSIAIRTAIELDSFECLEILGAEPTIEYVKLALKKTV